MELLFCIIYLILVIFSSKRSVYVKINRWMYGTLRGSIFSKFSDFFFQIFHLPPRSMNAWKNEKRIKRKLKNTFRNIWRTRGASLANSFYSESTQWNNSLVQNRDKESWLTSWNSILSIPSSCFHSRQGLREERLISAHRWFLLKIESSREYRRRVHVRRTRVISH